jgi:hypothetical protein
MRRLFRDTEEVPTGAHLWAYLSGVTHGAMWAILQARQEEPISDPLGGHRAVLVLGTSAASVGIYAVVLMGAIKRATDARHAYYGWTSERWQAAQSTAQHSMGLNLDAIGRYLDSTDEA